MSEKDKSNLLAIIDSCTKIRKFTEHIYDADTLFADQRTFDAVLMNFIIIGEAVSRLTDEIKEDQNQISWIQIKGFRNIVAHNYFGVDAEELWQIIKSSLLDFEKEIKAIIIINDE